MREKECLAPLEERVSTMDLILSSRVSARSLPKRTVVGLIVLLLALWPPVVGCSSNQSLEPASPCAQGGTSMISQTPHAPQSISTPTPPVRSPSSVRWTKVQFFDEKNGWDVIEVKVPHFDPLPGSSIVHTTDGGLHWHEVFFPSMPGTVIAAPPDGRETDLGVSSATFVSATTAWVAMYSLADNVRGKQQGQTLLLQTTDAGQTWQKKALFPSVAAYQVAFVNAQEGWIFLRGMQDHPGQYTLARTSDGGNTWFIASDLRAIHVGDWAVNFHFQTLCHGWASKSDGGFFTTQDGGKIWKLQSLPVPASFSSWHKGPLSPTFFSEKDGVLPVIYSHVLPKEEYESVLMIYTTHDGGLSWQNTSSALSTRLYWNPYGDPAVSPIMFLDRQHGLVLDRNGYEYQKGDPLLSVTDDGGKHWRSLPPDQLLARRFDLQQLYFVSKSIGWIVGALSPRPIKTDADMHAPTQSVLLKTVDGGRTWSIFPSVLS
jgi:photosystem II stability/assembly factor-like uncharacterized protein